MGPRSACYGIGTTSNFACCVTGRLLSGILNGLTDRSAPTCRVLDRVGNVRLRCARCRPLFSFMGPVYSGRRGGTFFVAYSDCIAVDSNANVIRVTPTFNRSSSGINEGCSLPFIRLIGNGNRVARRAPCTNGFIGSTSILILASLRGTGLLFSTPGFRRSCPFY